MGIEFTKEQQQVIDLRDRNILVSAAAGSGKTAVLVERIITRLTKDASPIDVDRLLVVTYTEAAAAEMKERIRNAIEKALEEHPENEHLQRQATLIHQAKVTTIHSFCVSVIRDYFHTIDLDPGFRVAEDGELKLLKQDIIDEVLEQWYQKASSRFLYLVDSFAGNKDDSKLGELILKLYEYSRSYPNPNSWLDKCVQYYGISSVEELNQAPFISDIMSEIKMILGDVRENLLYAKTICCEEDGPRAYEEALDSDILWLRKIQASNTFSEMQKVLSSFEWKTLSRKAQKDALPAKKEAVKAIRDKSKETIATIRKQYFYDDIDNMLKSMNSAKGNVETLIALVKDFANQFADKKQSKNMIDFSDMEHYALKILTREENGELVPSPAAKEYQEKFEEIMIDEYQDSNYVQETILTSVSSVSQGKYNIFMVGDVKQSIYQFRLARPELFMQKYHSYSQGASKEQRIDLHKNFRSRQEVLESTNYIFKQIMTERFGGIEYDDKAALYVGADYEERLGNETEVLLVDVAEGPEELSVREMEGLVIANKIKELVGHHEVLDKKTGTYRKAQYKDIVVLMRSIQGWTDVFLPIFKEEGIPAYSVSKEGYFEAREIQMVLDYLRVLDNPRQDIPLAAVLCSPFVGLTAEELAIIKNNTREKQLYESVLSYLGKNTNTAIHDKLKNFQSQIEKFRNKVPYTAIHELLWNILDETGFENYIATLPSGEQRLANLEMLVEKAISFESTSYKGLFHFVRYIEQLQKYKVDYGEADIQEESANVVNLMTIHKSKGLEFPIVFVAGMDKRFNLRDTNASVVLHSQLGVGIDFVDVESREKSPSLLRRVIQREMVKESVAEELRVLYVAMTRAKEKMILTGTVKDLEKRLADYEELKYHRKQALPYTRITGAKKYFDWVLPALYRNRAMESAKVPIVVKVVRPEDIMVEMLEEEWKDSVTKQILCDWSTDSVYDESMKEHIKEQFSFCYPYENEAVTKQKVSVSEIKKQAYLEEEEMEEEVIIPLLPKFMQQDSKLTGALRGTAYHRVLELLDFTEDYDESALEEKIQEMVVSHLLSKEMAESVTVTDILKFLNSTIGKRMKAASQNNQFHAEQPFVLGEERENAEMILVQGIVDVYFEENGELVVLDYKTDKVWEAKELIERYKLQLDYYAKVLQQVTGKRVKEKLIYSFALQKEIQV